MKTFRDLMEGAGFTVLSLAAAMEAATGACSVPTVLRWMNGDNVPPSSKLTPLAKVLGVPVGELLEACNASVEARKAAAA